MNFVKVASYYGSFVQSFYRSSPGIRKLDYQAQLRKLLAAGFSWADFLEAPLASQGFHVTEIIRNVEPLQRQWGRENGMDPDCPLAEITAAQIQAAQPQVLWFEEPSDEVAQILEILEANSARPKVVLGWTGSYVPTTRLFGKVDVTLSCAPESVEFLRSQGYVAEHFNHAFGSIVAERLDSQPYGTGEDVAFFGHIIRSDGFHRERTELLSQLVRSGVNLKIYTPQLSAGSGNFWFLAFRNLWHTLLWPGKATVFGMARALRGSGVPESRLSRNPFFRRALELKELPPVLPVPNDMPAELLPRATPPVFGMDMYRALRRAKIVLNVHADSSPRYASNMRLFEVTGAGGLLLTDWKENLGELFKVDEEIVAYRSLDECREKIQWLLNHPEEAAKIARAGQLRCLRDHSFAQRMPRLMEILQPYGSLLGENPR